MTFNHFTRIDGSINNNNSAPIRLHTYLYSDNTSDQFRVFRNFTDISILSVSTRSLVLPRVRFTHALHPLPLSTLRTLRLLSDKLCNNHVNALVITRLLHNLNVSTLVNIHHHSIAPAHVSTLRRRTTQAHHISRFSVVKSRSTCTVRPARHLHSNLTHPTIRVVN